jgi:cytochrome c oxidase subunit II
MASSTAQSSLHPAADSSAALIDQLGTVLYVGVFAIFVVVMALAIYGVYAKARPINAQRWIIGGGLLFPIVTLTTLLLYSLAIGNGLSAIGSSNALQLFLDCFGIGSANTASATDRLMRVHVVGKQWWWEVRYEQPGRSSYVVLANEVRIPLDTPVEFVLTTSDVIHSFWVPSLAGKVDMIPGRTTRLRVQTSELGTFRGQCAEYCGGQHALMALFVVTQSAADFDAWLMRQSHPVTEPTDPFLRTGYEAFFRGDCHSCHTIRGTPANGIHGPDLTHVGGRKSLGAGVLNNHAGTMAGWIAGAQDIKPGNQMPSPPLFTGVELRALTAWLGSLE